MIDAIQSVDDKWSNCIALSEYLNGDWGNGVWVVEKKQRLERGKVLGSEMTVFYTHVCM